MRRALILAALLITGRVVAQPVNGWQPLGNGWSELKSSPATGTVTTTGTLASGQVALGSGATSVTSNDGLTHQGSGTTFKLGLGTRVFLSAPSAGTLLVEDGSGNARDVQARTGTFSTSVVTPVVSHTDYVTITDGHTGGGSVYFSAGNVYPATNNAQDLGAANIWRTGYFGTSVVTPVVSGGAPATGTNIAGTTTTVAGQLGTGTGASGDQVFTVGTPQASGTGQHVAATALTLHNAGSGGTAAPQALLPDGTSTLPALGSSSVPGSGMFFTSGQPRIAYGGLGAAAGATYQNGLMWQVVKLDVGFSGDVLQTRGGANTLQLGDLDAASPVAQTLQVQGSRGGTDTNVAGGNLTIRPGAGTGSATGSSIVFQTPTATGSGTGAQTQTTRLTVSEGSIVPAVPIVSGNYIYASNFRSYTGDNLDDIGQSGTKFKTGFFGTSVVTPVVQLTLATPTTSGDTCVAGTFWADASYLYVCTATNTIKRAALSAF